MLVGVFLISTDILEGYSLFLSEGKKWKVWFGIGTQQRAIQEQIWPFPLEGQEG